MLLKSVTELMESERLMTKETDKKYQCVPAAECFLNKIKQGPTGT